MQPMQHRRAFRPDGARECGHGWSKAQPVNRVAHCRSCPEGAEETNGRAAGQSNTYFSSNATPGERELTIHARAKVLDEPAWTIATLVGKRLFLRDRTTVTCIRLP